MTEQTPRDPRTAKILDGLKIIASIPIADTPTDDMVERVARILYEANPGAMSLRVAGQPVPWEQARDQNFAIADWTYRTARAAIAALAPAPDATDALQAILVPLAAAWDAHVLANSRTNAAIPAINATRAERTVYDERYQASEEAKREMYRAAWDAAKAASAALAPGAGND